MTLGPDDPVRSNDISRSPLQSPVEPRVGHAKLITAECGYRPFGSLVGQTAKAGKKDLSGSQPGSRLLVIGAGIFIRY